jgi:hypothetical protein
MSNLSQKQILLLSEFSYPFSELIHFSFIDLSNFDKCRICFTLNKNRTAKAYQQTERWRLHSFDFAFGWVCALAGKDKCVQCAVAIEFFVGELFLKNLFSAWALEAVWVVVQVVRKGGFKSVSLMVARSPQGFC